ncbi:uncharacterized protein LOC144391290 [Gasterosteus aculeatus]
MASGAVDLFIADPSLEGLLKLTKVDLLAVAANYGITTTKQSLKPVIVATISQHLLAHGVVASQEEEEDKDEEGLERVEVPPGSSPIRPEGGVGVESRVPLTLPKFQPSPEESGRSVETARLRLRVARLEADLRDKAERRQQEYELELRKLDIKRLEVETSKEIRKMEIQAETEVKIQIRQLELAAGVSSSPPVGREGPFDVGRNIAIVPPFRESEVDSHFSAFERVAGALHWPKEVWPLLLQCKLTGKAQEVVASLSLEESGQYDLVKAAVLRAYELVPEAYRQRFRNHRKSSNKTFVEFARDKESLFDRWCAASKASTYATLRELTLLEDFKSHLPDDIVVHLNEQKVATVAHAAVMADEYALTHKTVFYPSTPTHGPRPSNSQAVRTSRAPAAQPFTRGPSKAERECFYCRLPGHLIADCPTLKAKPKGPLSPSLSKGVGFVGPKKPSVVYSPFLSKGWVSLCDEASQQPITILRDTGAAQSIIVSTSLPWSEKSYFGSHVLLTGIEMGTISVSLHWVYPSSSIVSGRVRVGVVPRLPVDGVSFLLGNDIAGGRVVPVPEVVDNPDPAYTGTETDRSVFPACVVTRAQERKMKNVYDVSSLYQAVCDPDPRPPNEKDKSPPPSVERIPEGSELELVELVDTITKSKVIECQQNDESLQKCFEAVDKPVTKESNVAYGLENGLLVRKWTARPSVGVSECVYQVVLPTLFRQQVLSLAHDYTWAGHLGIRKTYDRVLRHFFWPGLKKDVIRYCNACKICQLAGKPNQGVPRAPLFPIPVVSGGL